MLSHCPHTSPIPCSLEANDIGTKGASALAAILKETQITNLKCAAPQRSLLCQCPLTLLTIPAPPSVHSLEDNWLGPELGATLAEGLKGNSMLRVLK